MCSIHVYKLTCVHREQIDIARIKLKWAPPLFVSICILYHNIDI